MNNFHMGIFWEVCYADICKVLTMMQNDLNLGPDLAWLNSWFDDFTIHDSTSTTVSSCYLLKTDSFL